MAPVTPSAAGAPGDIPEVSVVIPTRGRPAVLGETLAALARQGGATGRMEVLVGIDGADPETLDLLAERASQVPWPLVALPLPRGGQGRARNAGIARARGRIVLLLDDDILAGEELVEEHLRQHAGREDRVVTGSLPLAAPPGEPAHHRAVRRWWDGELAAMAAPGHRPSFRDFVTGNVSVPRAALLAAGGFDPDFVGYGREDYELGYRLLRRGLSFVHAPRARGLHRYAKPVLEWLRQFEPQGRADVLFARKHPEIAPEIMNLSPFPAVPWDPGAVAASEQAVLCWNGAGGALWEQAAGFAKASYYWRGLRAAARDERELAWLVAARRAGWRARRWSGRRSWARLLDRVGRLFPGWPGWPARQEARR
jgi:GT2 family glycosyltransferase